MQRIRGDKSQATKKSAPTHTRIANSAREVLPHNAKEQKKKEENKRRDVKKKKKNTCREGLANLSALGQQVLGAV